MYERTPSVPPVILPVESSIKRPMWSIMIPTYNCHRYLAQCIKSVLAQDQGQAYMQIEVIDDCSTDGDIEALVCDLGQGRIGFYKQATNVGSLRNFETCLTRAKGYRVHLLHGDDRVHNGFYHEIDALFKENQQIGAAFTGYSFIDVDDNLLDITCDKIQGNVGLVRNFLLDIGRRQLIQPPSIVVRRDVYEQIGSFYAVHFGEDWEMWCRIASRFPVAYSPKVLAEYRVSNRSSISHRSFMSGQNIIDIKKVIEIIGKYIPLESRKETERLAKEYYSLYCIKVANALLLQDKRVAKLQVRGALGLNLSLKTIIWAIRFYLMYFSRFKSIQAFFENKSK
jgi:glycosyltransferase involved in cell wall biosynthesis